MIYSYGAFEPARRKDQLSRQQSASNIAVIVNDEYVVVDVVLVVVVVRIHVRHFI